MKPKKIIGYVLLSLPFLFFVWSVLDTMSGQCLLGKLLLEGVGFPVVDWIRGSYSKTLLVWVGGTVFCVSYVGAITFFLTGNSGPTDTKE